MDIKKIRDNKYILATLIIAIIAVILEVFGFNYSAWYSRGLKPIVLAENVSTDESSIFYSETVTVDDYVKNIKVNLTVENYELAYVSAIITDEGDKYEYSTPEYTVCNGVERSGFSNIYPFDKVHTLQVKVRTEDGCRANIESIIANERIPVCFKAIRFILIFAVMWFGYMVWTESKLHEVYFDEKKGWQWCITVAVMIGIMVVGMKVAKADLVLQDSPWPHHKQYQELAHSLANGTVELTEQYVDPALLEVDNPYDTITLWTEGIVYSMDYAFYDGKYYEYFGIMPELAFYYPYYKLKGQDMRNYQVMMILYVFLVAGVFITITGLVKKYAKSMPYFFYLMLCVATSLCANFVYLTAKSDIYNVPVLMAVTCSILGIGCWLEAMNTERVWLRRVSLVLGSFSMAMVAGCRPQLLLLSGIGVIFFLLEDGWKNRKLLTKSTAIDTVVFVIPYFVIAVIVCWYNYARFGNILDFGATYSLTTNDMNHRGFNMNRLLRSMYSYLLQPATINTDFPFLNASFVGGNYMGRFLYESTFGGMLVTNTMMVSLWIGAATGFKKLNGGLKAIVLYCCGATIFIAGFDGNCAGVLYRYTCDFAPAFIIAAVIMWIVFLDKSRNVINYSFAARIAYVCILLALAYALLTFVASGSSLCLADDNRRLYYTIAEYFKF